MSKWFSLLSSKQKILFASTLVLVLALIIVAFNFSSLKPSNHLINATTDMSIRQVAAKLGVTGKSLARELDLPIKISKNAPLKELNVSEQKLRSVVHHLAAHRETSAKYVVFIALCLFGLIYMLWLGKPEHAGFKQMKFWYPRFPYLVVLISAVLIAGFYFGKSPNPMESVVKVFKSMVGLYPDQQAKLLAFGFFILLAIVGNKLVCGWACPFGALQELIYSLPLFKKLKQYKLPFGVTNSIRAGLFVLMLFMLFGVFGPGEGFVIYHYINPFNLFDWNVTSVSIAATLLVVGAGAFVIYRPFCQLICPFGLVSWLFESLSIARIQIDKQTCRECIVCAHVCPLDAAKDRVEGKKAAAECYSCMRCLTVCPQESIQYKTFFSTFKPPLKTKNKPD